MRYAGFWLRFVAAVIDSIIISIIAYILVSLLGLNNLELTQSYYDALNSPSTLLHTGIFWLYFAVLESSPLQATFGKKILGLRVTDDCGNRISFLRACGRYLGKIVSAFIFMIGFIMVAFSSRKQGLHDKMANCYVVKGL
jgi:uncharacterized RDD family membrane protein YckC